MKITISLIAKYFPILVSKTDNETNLILVNSNDEIKQIFVSKILKLLKVKIIKHRIIQKWNIIKYKNSKNSTN